MAAPARPRLRDLDFGITSSLRRLVLHPVVDGVGAGICYANAAGTHGVTEAVLLVAGSALAFTGLLSHVHLRSRAVNAENQLGVERRRHDLGL